jgi:hypothetical protein
MSRFAFFLLAPLVISCVDEPRTPRAAVPVKSACTAGSRPPASVGFDVRQGRRHSDARTLFATNLGDRPRTVRVQQVARVEGPCSGEWARQTQLAYVDAATCEAPSEVTLKPGEWLELQVGAQRVAPTWECAKLGMALWLEVDGEVVCADAGAWIAEGGDRE